MKGMKVNLPTGISGQTQSKANTSVSRSTRMARSIATRLRWIPMTSTNSLVEVHRDRSACQDLHSRRSRHLHGDMIRLIEQVRSAGFYKIAFEIKSPSLPNNSANQ